MTSGPMPSPDRRRSLWVAIAHCLDWLHLQADC
jgi:hypothetical protein